MATKWHPYAHLWADVKPSSAQIMSAASARFHYRGTLRQAHDMWYATRQWKRSVEQNVNPSRLGYMCVRGWWMGLVSVAAEGATPRVWLANPIR